jgi:hypothetical protein
MTIRNRELSQFGSFIHVENSNQEIGITTGAFPYVGIGTMVPQYKLHVFGDTGVTGIVSATGFYLNGNELVDATLSTWSLSGTDVYVDAANVGIGTSVPTSKLEIVGDVTATSFISNVDTGTPPLIVNSTTQVSNLNASLLAGKDAPAGDLVGTTDTQTLTNKTLTNPRISAIHNNSFILNVPLVNGTLVSTGSTGVVTSEMIADLNITNDDVATGAGITYGKLSLTNSILDSDVKVGAGISYNKLNLSGSITNSDIAPNAGITTSKLFASTISGVPLGSNLRTLTFGTYLTGTSYNGSTDVTLATNATSANTPSSIVARDGNGSFTAGTITCSDLNSTSDKNLKTDVSTFNDALYVINQLRGVNFTWKGLEKQSIGVIAQEVEEILPQLVETSEHKSVNYNGLIGVLIQAVKELSNEVEELKSRLDN